MTIVDTDPLGSEVYGRIARLLAADTSDFNQLVKLAGLNPAMDFRHADLAGTCMAGADLSGFDFSFSDFRNVNLSGARIAGARFECADLAGTDLTTAVGLGEAHLDFAIIQDAPFAPELVVIPGGRFIMGDNRHKDSNGYPLTEHLMTIAHRFAVGRYPVTLEEYDHFTNTTGRDQLSDQGWGRGRRPAIGVYWTDAKAYVEWLSEQTGQPYRLLSEAEWEYACRAGTTTRYWWGDDIDPEKANGDGDRTTEVGSFPPNPWGLYDMHGNVWEWVEDEYSLYNDASPLDGSARVGGGSGRWVMRGGSYLWAGWSAARDDGRYPINLDGNIVGLRVARTLPR